MKKTMRFFEIVIIITISLGYLMLCGCARKTPTQTIIDSHVDHINQVIDYANNNMEQTPEIILLEKELESCVTGLQSVGKTHKTEIATCEAKTDYWRLSSASLVVALIVAIYLLIKRR